MSLEIVGKLVKVLPEVGGQSKSGNAWRKQEFVIETLDQYPKKICLNVWGDRIDILNSFGEGDEIKVSFDVESREYQERWYTDIKAWRIERNSGTPNTQNNATQAEDPFPDDFMASGQDPDLPF
jgi:hypothetical protein